MSENITLEDSWRLSPIIDPAAWKPIEIEKSENWIYRFSDKEINELLDAASRLVSRNVDLIHVEKGDIFRLATIIPFSQEDSYMFTTSRSIVNRRLAKEQLDRVAVVPNPYVVAASWEPRHIYNSGRGPRKVDFINLPIKSLDLVSSHSQVRITLSHTFVIETLGS